MGQTPRPLGVAYASWGSRVRAYLVDLAVIVILGVVVLVIAAIGEAGSSGDEVSDGTVALFLMGWFVLALFYAPLLMIRRGDRNGQTWGKQALGIRVVRDDGEPFEFGPAGAREILIKQFGLWFVSMIGAGLPFLFNYLWPLWDKEHRALHDMIASTHVVEARRS